MLKRSIQGFLILIPIIPVLLVAAVVIGLAFCAFYITCALILPQIKEQQTKLVLVKSQERRH